MSLLPGISGKRLPEQVQKQQDDDPKGDVRRNIPSNLQLLFYSEAVCHKPLRKRSHSSAIAPHFFVSMKRMLNLTAAEVRALGALIEKGITTPEYYPLSLNALVSACNQKSSREPVMELSEADVRTALFELEGLGFVRVLADSRVSKFEHLAYGKLSLGRPETAVLGLLLLRGPQTSAELRTRSERMYTFDDTFAVNAVLERLAGRDEPLVVQLARQPGARESRWMHLLGGSVENAAATGEGVASARTESATALEERVANLECTVQALEERLRALEPPQS